MVVDPGAAAARASSVAAEIERAAFQMDTVEEDSFDAKHEDDLFDLYGQPGA